MFARCVTRIRIAAKTPYAVSGNERVNAQMAMGASTLPSIDPTEEYRVSAAPAAQPPTATSPAGQQSAKIAPNDVATPFPPLKRSHGEKQWPSTAPAATRAA